MKASKIGVARRYKVGSQTHWKSKRRSHDQIPTPHNQFYFSIYLDSWRMLVARDHPCIQPKLKACETYALVNFMPHSRGGWGNTGDLTNDRCQIPHYWGKIGCQIPTMPPPLRRGFDNTSRLTKHIFHAHD